MLPTLARMSKASRLPLNSKQGNKDFYKGTRQAALPGDRRTGAPGRHIIRGKGRYMLDDTKVRYYVAPPLAELNSTQLRPYVEASYTQSDAEKKIKGRFTPELLLRHAKRQAVEGLAAQREAGTAPTIVTTQVKTKKVQGGLRGAS